MSKELQVDDLPGLWVWETIEKINGGQVWNNSTLAFESFLQANVADYAIRLPAEANSGEDAALSPRYRGDMPTLIPAGEYNFTARIAAIPGSPALTDRQIGGSRDFWSGSQMGLAPYLAAISIAIPGPILPSICILWDYEQDERGFVEGSEINLSLATPPQVTSTGILESTTQSTESRWDGYWEIPMVQGKQYMLDIPQAGVVSKIITAPAQARIQARTFFS